MGIKGLAKLLTDEAPDAVREVSLSSLHGRKIAVDASMAIYQFLIAVRSSGAGAPAVMLTNAQGETTSHIQGLFNRTIRFLTEGIRPIYIFDGKPPSLKSGELKKRWERRQRAQKELEKATELGNVEEQDKQSKRLVRAGAKENQDCQTLLEYMGVPVLVAPCEAEAQAAALAKAGVVYATATEDMDALTFQTPLLLRRMTFANAAKSNIQTVNYARAIEGLNLTEEQFVDLCILLGCDYCDTIRGVGPKTALKLIRQHGTIEKILKHIQHDKKYGIPDNWLSPEQRQRKKQKVAEPKDTDDEEEEEEEKKDGEEGDDDEDDDEEHPPAYEQARQLFQNHPVTDASEVELKWKECQPEALTKFLVDDMGFQAERVKASIEKLKKAHQKATTKPQARMDSFFKVKPRDPSFARKAASSDKNNNKKKATSKRKR